MIGITTAHTNTHPSIHNHLHKSYLPPTHQTQNKMPKSTGPLQEQLGLGTANQSTPSTTYPSGSNNMSDATTSAADKLGANKSTNAFPQENPSILSSAGAIGKNCMSPFSHYSLYNDKGDFD